MAWSYEQKFNTLNDGDLNGQDSWSIDTSFDVQTTTKYEGAKAVAVINPAGEVNGYRAITGVDAGTFYFAMRRSVNNAGTITFTARNSTPLTQWKIIMNNSGNVQIDNGSSVADWFAYSANTWYVFEVVFTTTTVKARYNAGAGWSNYSTEYTPLRSNNVERIYLTCEDASTSSNYWDTITPTDPVVIAYTMAADPGTFALTGIASTFNKTLTMAAALGHFILTGIDATLTYYNAPTPPTEWDNETKHSTNWGDSTKNSTNYSNQIKSTSIWHDKNKSS